MKKRLLTIAFTLCSVFIGLTQEPVITAEVDMDSVLLGNYLELTITAENVPNAEIEAPDFGGLQLMSGPQYASSMQIINGDLTQSVSYTYWLEPKDVGQYYIGSAQVKAGNKVLETVPIEINTYHNPDGIIQRPKKESVGDSWFQWPERKAIPAPKKKERRSGKFIGCEFSMAN